MEASPRKSSATAAQARNSDASLAQQAFMRAHAAKDQVPCPYIGRGKCTGGTRCGFMHVGKPEEWAQYECMNGKRPSGICDAFPNCIYKGCVDVSRTTTDAAQRLPQQMRVHLPKLIGMIERDPENAKKEMDAETYDVALATYKALVRKATAARGSSSSYTCVEARVCSMRHDCIPPPSWMGPTHVAC